jgi:hypothetical protein
MALSVHLLLLQVSSQRVRVDDDYMKGVDRLPVHPFQNPVQQLSPLPLTQVTCPPHFWS